MTRANRVLRAGSATAAALTLAISLDVYFHGLLTRVDTWVEPGFIPKTPTIWTHLAAALDAVSDPKLAGAIAIASGLVALRMTDDRSALARALLAVGAVSASVYVLKLAIARKSVWLVASTSFPSGHAAMAVVLGWTLGRFAAQRAPSPLRWAAVTAAAWGGIVGWSRVILNAHWVSDVLAGLAMGFAVVTAFELLANPLEPEPGSRQGSAQPTPVDTR